MKILKTITNIFNKDSKNKKYEKVKSDLPEDVFYEFVQDKKTSVKKLSKKQAEKYYDTIQNDLNNDKIKPDDVSELLSKDEELFKKFAQASVKQEMFDMTNPKDLLTIMAKLENEKRNNKGY